MGDEEKVDNRWTIRLDADNPRIDGEYKLSLGDLDGNEAHLIMEVSNVGLFELDDAFKRGNYDFFLALTQIALQRNGKGQVPIQYLRGLKLGAVKIEPPEAEDDPQSAQENESEPNQSGNVRPISSGPTSERHSATQAPAPPPTGPLHSATTSA